MDLGKHWKVKDLINYSLLLYQEQSYKFDNTSVLKDLSEFLLERLRYYMKDKAINDSFLKKWMANMPDRE